MTGKGVVLGFAAVLSKLYAVLMKHQPALRLGNSIKQQQLV